jgi:hypothetical protein
MKGNFRPPKTSLAKTRCLSEAEMPRNREAYVLPKESSLEVWVRALRKRALGHSPGHKKAPVPTSP